MADDFWSGLGTELMKVVRGTHPVVSPLLSSPADYRSNVQAEQAGEARDFVRQNASALMNGDQAALGQFAALAGPQAAMALRQGNQQLQAGALQNGNREADLLGNLSAAVMARPADQRAAAYAAIRPRLESAGVTGLPAAYDEGLLSTWQRGGQPAQVTIGQSQVEADRAANRAALGTLLGGQPAAAGDPALPRGERNNNPLNITDGSFTRGMAGYAGGDGRFARFQSPEQGMAAADTLLQRYAAGGLVTPLAIISRWAPAGDGNNNPQAYAGYVAQRLGVRPDQQLDMADPQVRQQLAGAMAEFENGRRPGGSQPAGPNVFAGPGVPAQGQAGGSGGILDGLTPGQQASIRAAAAAPNANPAQLAQMAEQFRQHNVAANRRERPDYDTVQTADGVFRVNKADPLDRVRVGDRVPARGAPDGRMPAALQKLDEQDIEAIQAAGTIQSDLGTFRGLIETGQLPLGGMTNMVAGARNWLGASTPESRNYASFNAALERLRNESLRLNKGVQTEGDSQRAWNELITNINDPQVVRQRLSEIERINQRAAQLRLVAMNRRRQQNGAEPIDPSSIGMQPDPAYGQGATPPAGLPGAQPSRQQQPTRISGDAEYDALPSGATFIAPDGTTRRKP
jgi:hypothetical protein